MIPLMIAVVFWGFSYVAIKLALVDLSPTHLVAARFVLAIPTLWLIGRAQGKSFSLTALTKVDRVRLVAVGVVLAAHFWIMAEGMLDTTANNTAWILAAAPVCIVALARFTLKERLSLVQYGGMAIAACGVLYLVSDGRPSNIGWISSRGDLLVLITDLTWAVFTVYTGFLIRKLDPLVLTFYSSCIAAAVIIPVALTGGFADYANVTILSGGSVIFLGIGCLAMAFWCYTIGIAQFGAGRAGAYLYLEPVFTVLGAYYFLNEKVTMVLVAAAILITLGVYLCERRSSSVVQKPPAG